jgi:hypothetical protein
MLPLLSFLALRHSPGAAVPFLVGGSPDPPRATSGVWLPPSRRTPPSLPAHEAPERPWAYPFEARPRRGGVPLGTSALLTFPRPPTRRCGPAYARAFRALLSRRSRRPTREGPPPNLPWGSPLQSSPSRRPGSRFGSRCPPSHPPADLRVSPPGSQGPAKRRARLVRLRTAGSPGVPHLPTVTAHRTSSRGGGSWFHLARTRACARAPRS